MSDIDSIIKLMTSVNSWSKHTGLKPQVSAILKEQLSWKDKIGGLGISSIARSLNLESIFEKQEYSMIEAVVKTLSFQSNLTLTHPSNIISEAIRQTKSLIPTSALEDIQSVVSQHKHLFDTSKFISESFEHNFQGKSQLKSLLFSLNSSTIELSKIAATQKNWLLLTEFKNISGQAIDAFRDEVLTEEESKRFEALIEYVLSFIKKNKKFATHALFYLSVIVNIMALHQYYDFVKYKPAVATKQDLVSCEAKLIQTITEKLKIQKEFRTTNRSCPVFLKPSNKTLVIEALPENFEVVCLQTNHKWVYVSFAGKSDNLPKTGWILKKYLDRP